MFKQAFLNFSDSTLAVTGFLLFLAVFLGVLVWTLGIQKISHYQELAQLPLKNGDDDVRSK